MLIPIPQPRSPLWIPGQDRCPRPLGWPTRKPKQHLAIANRVNVTMNGTTASSRSQLYSGLTGLANDDIIVVLGYIEDQLTATVAGSNTFTQMFQQNSAAGGVQIRGFWSRANSVSGSITMTLGSSTWSEWIIQVYSGVITTGDPTDAAAVTSAPGSQNTIPLPSITTITNGAMVAGFGASISAFTSPSAPTDWTSAGYVDEVVGGYQLKASAGATTLRNWSVSSTDQVMGAVWAMTPAGGAAATNIPRGITVVQTWPWAALDVT